MAAVNGSASESENSSDLSGASEALSQINMTPFVDVVLVLLIIFMVTAPLITKDILNIQLPKTVSGDGKVTQTFGIAVNREGRILLNGQAIDDEGLKQAVVAQMVLVPDLQAVIAADHEAIYGRVVHVIDLLKTAGLQRFAVQIEKEDKP